MRVPRDEVKADLQDCVRTVFADVLRKEGFQSSRGEDLNWYRLVNDDVVQSVCFAIIDWIYLFCMLDMEYTQRLFGRIFRPLR